MKILTVDDSRMIRSIIGNTITMLGYEKLEAENAEVGLQVVEQNVDDIKLILLDWNMPGMNGYELLKILKSNDRYKHIPVMMVTTEGERKSVIQAIRSGADNYLTKPFTPEDLSTKILECIGVDDMLDLDMDMGDLEL